ncbi:MAG TPA: orotate phosphoribosyltransferase [Chloroflexota bacterium]
MQDTRAALLRLLRRDAVLRGSFVLSSGQTSDYYLDARLVTLSAAGSHLVGRHFLQVIDTESIDCVAGLTVGADPIVSAIATMAGSDGISVDGLIVRKSAKDHGAGRRIEGPWRPGLRVAVVDDTLTTGASALLAAEAIQQEGGTVCGVYALIDREQGARQAVEAAGHQFTSLFTAGELLAL